METCSLQTFRPPLSFSSQARSFLRRWFFVLPKVYVPATDRTINLLFYRAWLVHLNNIKHNSVNIEEMYQVTPSNKEKCVNVAITSDLFHHKSGHLSDQLDLYDYMLILYVKQIHIILYFNECIIMMNHFFFTK